MRSPRAGATSSLLGGPGQAASIPEGQTEVHRRRSSRLAYDAFGESALKAARCMAWKPTRHCARVPCARHDRRHVDMARLCGHDQPDHWTIALGAREREQLLQVPIETDSGDGQPKRSGTTAGPHGTGSAKCWQLRTPAMSGLNSPTALGLVLRRRPPWRTGLNLPAGAPRLLGPVPASDPTEPGAAPKVRAAPGRSRYPREAVSAPSGP